LSTFDQILKHSIPFSKESIGDIVEVGSHDSLMAKKGFYADLYQSQFEHGEE
jgi:hypothetical protein